MSKRPRSNGHDDSIRIAHKIWFYVFTAVAFRLRLLISLEYFSSILIIYFMTSCKAVNYYDLFLLLFFHKIELLVLINLVNKG